jgi:hypothetical protein
MTLKDTKILPDHYAGKDIAGLPDRPELSASDMKARFDALSKEVLAPKHNAAVEILTGPEGASQIGTKEGVSVQAALDAAARKENVLEKTNAVPFAPTSDYHPATKKYVDDAAFKSGAVASVFGRAGNVVAQAGDYTAEMVGAYAKEEVLSSQVLEALSLSADAKPVDALGRIAEGETWKRLIAHPYIKLVSGEVLSLDLSGIQTDRYRQFMLFAQGNAYISYGNERLRFRINNDASASYAGTTLMAIHAADSSSTPYWTKAYSYNTVLMDFVPYIISETMPLSICAQFTPLGRHVQTQIQISNKMVTGLSFGSYWLAEGAEFSSIEMILHNFSGSRNVELNEIVLLGLEKGSA